MSNKIILCVKQGEEFNRGFTIKVGDEPLDLSTFTIKFQVKPVPLAKAPSIVDKTITTTSDDNTVGRINNPTEGQFFIHLLPEDTSYGTGDYPLIITLESPHYKDIISSCCCSNAIYRICEQ